MPTGMPGRSPLKLAFPQSLVVYDDYEAAQRAVDFLSDNRFPVEQCMIVGTDLKRIERITGRLTTGRVAMGGLLSGVWLGLFVGLILSLFSRPSSPLTLLLYTSLYGALFGLIWALVGYAFTRGARDFSSVSQIVATRYEVFCEHKFAQQGREILAKAGIPTSTGTGTGTGSGSSSGSSVGVPPVPPPGPLSGPPSGPPAG